jgi:hypothetical protein
VKIGVWENGCFIGSLIFSWGANLAMSQTVGLKLTECAELVRVALGRHRTPVSRIIAIAIRLLRLQSPRLRAIISYSDPYYGHHGGIYQAAGWFYLGPTRPERRYLHLERMIQRRAYSGHNFGSPARHLPAGAEQITVPGKHKYVMPLDAGMRERILPLAKPYPKRATSVDSDAPANHAGEGGASPTVAL